MADGLQLSKEEKQVMLNLLKKNHLFQGIDDAQIAEVANRFTTITLKAEERLFSQGEVGDSFYIIFRGSVRVVREDARTKETLATLVSGDYFGEEALLYQRRRSATIIANAPTTLLRLDKEHFKELLDKFPDIRPNLATTAESRQMARRKQFDWLGSTEVIYLIVRKHEAMLVLTLGGPVVLALFALPFFYVGALANLTTPHLIGGLILAGALLWGLWRAIDWGNDYYIVTNQRVIWLEKVIGLYDSRQEAPLGTVLSVGVESDQIGRILGYGDVIVRTYTGRIEMRHVSHPNEMKAHIDEYWGRTKESTRSAKDEAMVEAIRKKLDLPPLTRPAPTKPAAVEGREGAGASAGAGPGGGAGSSAGQGPAGGAGFSAGQGPAQEPNPLWMLLKSYTSTRFVDGSVITYRKHWYLLLKQAWLPTILLLFVGGVILSQIIGGTEVLSSQSARVVGISLLTVMVGWWMYEYIDWRNDKYQVTADQILDIDRKPLGKEEKKSAPLENILSLEHERLGLVAVLFNFGNVSATVGGTKFTFEGVHNPALVQQDIFSKMDARKKKKAEADEAAEREKMSSWLAAYHRNVTEFNRPAAPPAPELENKNKV